MFVSGIFQLIFSINNRNEIDNWGWYFAGAMFDFGPDGKDIRCQEKGSIFV
jgi:hypothetical protein